MSVFSGTWFDGKASRGCVVTVSVDHASGRLQVDTVDGRTVGVWAIGDVSLSARLGGAPRTLYLPPDGHVQLPDGPQLDQLLGMRSGRIERWADWLERRRLAIAVAAVSVLLLTVGMLRFGIPALAGHVAKHVPAAVERQVSDQTVVLLGRMGMQPSALSGTRRQWLQQAFARMVEGEPRAADLRLQFVRMDALGPNAFALPDGRIYLSDDLVALAGDDEQLMAVLAHEAGHHVHRHGMRKALESTSVFLLVGMVTGDVSGTSMTVTLPAALVDSHFSREHEREADAYAFALLRKHGMSPAAFARIMEKLIKRFPEGEGTSLLKSHPPTPERIAAARKAAMAD